MPRPRNPRRTLALALRRRVRVVSRFTVEPLDGERVRLTCQACGAVTEERPGDARPRGPAVGVLGARFLARYWHRGGVVSGSCSTCLAFERARRYPLD